MYQLFGLTPMKPGQRWVLQIAGLPVPRSGIYTNMPPEVVSAALGRIIHFLMLLQRYLPIVYPHTMQYNSSFSTIGSQMGEGAGCHTLFPDGSAGFDRGVHLLQQNVRYLCLTQGMTEDEIWPSQDLLGNLIKLRHCPTLGQVQSVVDVDELHPSPEKPSIQTKDHFL